MKSLKKNGITIVKPKNQKEIKVSILINLNTSKRNADPKDIKKISQEFKNSWNSMPRKTKMLVKMVKILKLKSLRNIKVNTMIQSNYKEKLED